MTSLFSSVRTPRGYTIALLLAFAAIVVTVVQNYRTIDTGLTQVALARRGVVAQLAATTLAEKFGRVVDVAVALATRPRVHELVAEGNWAEAVKFLQTVPQEMPFIERLFLADVEGTLRADVPELPGMRGMNFSHREWYQGVRRDWRPYVSPVYRRTAAPQLRVFAAAVPIRNAAQNVVGILVLQVRIERLVDWVKAIGMGPEGFLYIVDSNARLAFHSKHPQRQDMADLSAVPVVQKLRGGAEGVEIGFDPLAHEDVISAYASVADYGWGVVAQQPARASLGLAARDQQLRWLLIGYGLVFALCLTAAYLVSRVAAERQRTAGERRRKAELEAVNQQLRESEQQFNAFMNASPAIAWMKDDSGRHVYMSNSWEREFGLKREDWLGKTEYDLAAPEIAEKLREHDAEALRTGMPLVVIEETGGGPMGEIRYWHSVKFPFWGKLGQRLVGGWAVEITAQKRAERALQERDELLRSVGAMAHVGGWEFDVRTGRGTWTEEVARIHDMDPKEETNVEIGLAFYQGESREKIEMAVREAVAHGKPYDLELEMITAKGTRKWVRTIGQPVKEGDTVVKVRGSFQDITERLRGEQAMREYTDRLRRLSRRLFEVEEAERRRVARELHDRIGQNVTALTLNVNMIRGELPADCPGTVGTRLGDCETLLYSTAQLVRDVMADLRPPGLDELGLLAALTEHARQVAGRSRFSVTVRGTEVAPRPPPATEITLFRIAQEALVNVAKHAGATEVGIALESGPDTVVMTVADNGCGFDPTGPLTQVKASLGMINMRERAEAIGGRLRVESAPGQGTRVIVEVPRAA